jgi:hypothetical protein
MGVQAISAHPGTGHQPAAGNTAGSSGGKKAFSTTFCRVAAAAAPGDHESSSAGVI